MNDSAWPELVDIRCLKFDGVGTGKIHKKLIDFIFCEKLKKFTSILEKEWM